MTKKSVSPDVVSQKTQLDKTLSNNGNKISRGVQSIEKGFMIIEILANSSVPLSLKKISEQVKLPVSNVHHYLTSFSNIQIVTKNLDTGFYRLGIHSLQLGLSYLKQMDLLSTVKPIMLELSNKIGQTLFLGVWGNMGPTILYRVDGVNSETILDLRIGSVLPLLRSALGMNFASHMPYNIIKPFIKKELSKSPYNNIAELKKELEKIRKWGFSNSRETLLKNFTALSVPLLDFSETIFAGLTVMGRIDKINDEKESETVSILKEAAKKISSSYGYKI